MFRQLNEGDALAPLFAILAPIVLVCVFFYFFWQYIALVMIAIGAIAFLIFWYMHQPKKKNPWKGERKETWDVLPEEGPMKVNIIEDSRLISSINQNRFYLYVQVTLSKNDWYRIEQMGLMDLMLVEYKGDFGPKHPDNTRELFVKDLRARSVHIGYWNIQDMRLGKQTLVEALRNLKAQIEVAKEGPTTESFEI